MSSCALRNTYLAEQNLMFYPGTQSGIPLGSFLLLNLYINYSLKLLKARLPFFAHSSTKNVFVAAQYEVWQFLELESTESNGINRINCQIRF